MKKGLGLSVEKAAAFTLTAVGVSILLYIGIKYLLPISVPFLIAWCAALAVRPLARGIGRRTHLSVRVLQPLLLLFLLLLLFGGLFFLCSRLIDEVRELFEHLTANPAAFDKLIDRIGGVFGGASEGGYLSEILHTGASSLLTSLADTVGDILLSLPSTVFAVIITLVSAFYFAIDLQKIHAAAGKVIPSSLRPAVLRVKEIARKSVLRYLRAYATLALLTFCLLLVGFVILDVRFAFLIALLVTALDLLPVLGVGTALVPWGLFKLAMGEFKGGIGLLILFAAVFIVREIAEPKIVGSHMGVHPLLALIFTYAGLRLFGIVGMIAAPFAAVLVKGVLDGMSEEQDPSADLSRKGL